jgi:N-acetylglutamate synthase-like GNAT family acetyltransferase
MVPERNSKDRQGMNVPNITIKKGSELPFNAVIALYRAVGWKGYTEEPVRSKLLQAIQNSSYTVTAWDGDRLIGLARCITDDVSIFYLQDILVHPTYQRRGIGKTLLQDCLERFQHVRMKVLLTDDRQEQLRFYESLGFINSKHLEGNPLNTFIMVRDREGNG